MVNSVARVRAHTTRSAPRCWHSRAHRARCPWSCKSILEGFPLWLETSFIIFHHFSFFDLYRLEVQSVGPAQWQDKNSAQLEKMTMRCFSPLLFFSFLFLFHLSLFSGWWLFCCKRTWTLRSYAHLPKTKPSHCYHTFKLAKQGSKLFKIWLHHQMLEEWFDCSNDHSALSFWWTSHTSLYRLIFRYFINRIIVCCCFDSSADKSFSSLLLLWWKLSLDGQTEKSIIKLLPMNLITQILLV